MINETNEITMPREENPMNAKNSILNPEKKGISEHLEESEALGATGTTATTGLERPVNDNKGLNKRM